MKQSLQLRLGQSLTMTPQLQQAIKLLQLSTLDLQQEIQQALESNMMLEIDEEEKTDRIEKKIDSSDQMTSEGSQTDIPDELPIDSSWEDVFESSIPSMAGSEPGEAVEFENFRSKVETLQDHLVWQLEMSRFSERDHAIGVAIIDAIDDDGYLMQSVEEIHQGLSQQLDDLEVDEVQAVLHQIQNFDPLGIGCRDLAECLTLQLKQLPPDTPYRQQALMLVDYLEELVAHQRNRLARRLGMTETEFTQAIGVIKRLDPKPGAYFRNFEQEYIIPDVYVMKRNGEWQVSLNPEIAPKLRINPVYSGLIKRADNSQDNVFMKDHLQEARWFIKSLLSRNETLLKVAQSIVRHQLDFFEHGPIAMRPMVLRDVAEELELHESTISRVTTRKYMHTPSGIIEFKYFFSSHVSTSNGGECSATAIKSLIKEFVASEKPTKPLSDSKIANLLKEQGINVARRTVAKYREAMSIPPSSQRKKVL
ncbi:RNA polymerase factor sigma-54 [methane-oxidizing endosymbiont of Gigantopelta aegis]|uniref:RNA polymerase factor sigma-54 n=1 Tax=methane-oxidizing endosymbiont of Gigantopelta aegis TaxID=2794938 RepID=UPI0018DC49B8|nr:RNA polymerase factor sigma-54 [methane-oxidizing endosymbiont of Gigantopelta aegis]